jgi:hypothetical protein
MTLRKFVIGFAETGEGIFFFKYVKKYGASVRGSQSGGCQVELHVQALPEFCNSFVP